MRTNQELIADARENWLVAHKFLREAEDILHARTYRGEPLSDHEQDRIKDHLGCMAAHLETAIDLLSEPAEVTIQGVKQDPPQS